MHFAGERDDVDIFYGYKPSKYIEWFTNNKPDVLCLAEAPLDDGEGNSVFLSELAQKLGGYEYKVYVNDKSWIIEDKHYGTVILSKYPILEYESFNLPNPKLEVEHPDGSHWVMHDKGAQKALIDMSGKKVTVFSLHYFPVHHFKRRIEEEDFIPIRKALAKALTPYEGSESIVCGDFNNRGIHVRKAFPELFESDELSLAVEFDRNEVEPHYSGDGIQIDHILHSKGLEVANKQVEYTFSDHCALLVDFK